MTDEVLNLGDIPDLSGIGDEGAGTGFSDGWYQGIILEKREFTDKNGSDRVFESQDAPSANGGSRNIRLQVELKRQSDGRVLNTSTLINYQPADLSPETIQAVTAQKEKNKEGEEWGSLFRAFISLTRLGKLQKIAGVKQLTRNGAGGLDITPLYGKVAFFKLGDDDRSEGKFKAIKDFRDTKPTRVPVL